MSGSPLLAPSGFADQPIGSIAAALPGAAALFRRHKLDFCCGGATSLADAAAARGIGLAELEGELAALEPQVPVAPEETEALIDHILERYHAVHRAELPELIRLARRVEAVHREHHAAPAGLADLLETIEAELTEHQAKEEQILFPLMRAGGHPMIVHPIARMREEHEAHGANLAEILVLTNDITPPAEACNSWRALYAGLAKFAEDLTEHVHLENNLLFPRFTDA